MKRQPSYSGAALIMTAAVDGTQLVPADSGSLAGSGSSRTLRLTPLEAATGTGEE